VDSCLSPPPIKSDKVSSASTIKVKPKSRKVANFLTISDVNSSTHFLPSQPDQKILVKFKPTPLNKKMNVEQPKYLNNLFMR
jgi:hypothetical protein